MINATAGVEYLPYGTDHKMAFSDSKIYVLESPASYDRNALVVINGTDGKTLEHIPLEGYPSALAVNSKIYITNSVSNNVTVIDLINGTDYRIAKNISVGKNPNAIVVNEVKNLLYVANSGSKSISVINSSINEVVYGITFSTESRTAGDITCTSKGGSHVGFYRYSNKIISCSAKPYNGSDFHMWEPSELNERWEWSWPSLRMGNAIEPSEKNLLSLVIDKDKRTNLSLENLSSANLCGPTVLSAFY